jgi:Mg-chelatase subunit ChlD
MRWAPILAATSLVGCASAQPGIDALPTRSLDECNTRDFEVKQALDVAIVIDTSGSTAEPSGVDIDGDGIVGEFRDAVMTDRADSLLAAQVAGIRSVVAVSGLHDLRLSIVSFSGKDRFDDPVSAERFPDAILREELTSDPRELEAALDRVLRGGSRGTSNFAAAMRRSLEALDVGWRSAPADGRKRVVLMLADSPTPILPGPTQYLYRTPEGDPHGSVVRTDPHMAVAAKRAIRSHVVFNTFGLGEAADADPPHMLSRIAGATGGQYYAVKDPTELHCELMSALAQ